MLRMRCYRTIAVCTRLTEADRDAGDNSLYIVAAVQIVAGGVVSGGMLRTAEVVAVCGHPLLLAADHMVFSI